MNHLHPKQKQILEYLLENTNGHTADDFCIILDLTKTAVKEHLTKLEHMNYITFKDHKGLVGRPKRMYSLSDKGMEAFPKQYSWLSSNLLEHLTESLNPIQVTEILNGLAIKTAKSFEVQLSKLTSEEKLHLIVKVMNDLGYKAKLKNINAKGTNVIEAFNCVYHSVALKHPELCQFDIKFLEETSTMNVQMESCIAKGGSSCRFCLKAKN